MSETVSFPRELAVLIDRVFLPKNPHKMRQPHPDVLAAVIRWRQILNDPEQRLLSAVEYVNAHHPLPRCEHGSALRDGGGDVLLPSCGCRLLSGAAKEER